MQHLGQYLAALVLALFYGGILLWTYCVRAEKKGRLMSFAVIMTLVGLLCQTALIVAFAWPHPR